MSLLDENIHKRIIEKKIVLDAHRPFDPIFLKRLKHELMIEYTYNSNAIEGSTLTLNETRLVSKLINYLPTYEHIPPLGL